MGSTEQQRDESHIQLSTLGLQQEGLMSGQRVDTGQYLSLSVDTLVFPIVRFVAHVLSGVSTCVLYIWNCGLVML